MVRKALREKLLLSRVRQDWAVSKEGRAEGLWQPLLQGSLQQP